MTIKLIHITAVNGGGTIQLEFEFSDGNKSERRALQILDEQYLAMHIQKGEISYYTYDEIERASKICEGYKTAMNILSFGANTAYTLKQKLCRRGFSSDVAEVVVGMASDKGYINEEREIFREVERCLRKKWGMKRIMAQLFTKGYDDEALAYVEDELAEFDFSQNCYELLCSKYDALPTEPNEKRKLIASLVRYGYSMSEIQTAINKMKA